MKRQVVIFRTLANINRLKIINMLSGNSKMNVGDIAQALRISLKATSNHLAMLKNLDVLESLGSNGHVYYSLSKNIPNDFNKVLNCFRYR